MGNERKSPPEQACINIAFHKPVFMPNHIIIILITNLYGNTYNRYNQE